ncbi:Allene oxide synthase-lipoxygenase protein [Nymphon striatum]|nr:Allene oxide synthase-lipoxygenase protein [Nymphon striatum]
MLITCVKLNETTNTVEDLKLTGILQTDLNCYIAPPGFLVPNNAMECGVTIANAPFTDCNDTYWAGVTFYFGETEISKPMSEVCQHGAVSFNVQVDNDQFVQDGRFELILRDISSHYKPENNQWFIDTVSVNCPSQATSMKIGVGRQIDSGRLYTFLDYDTLTNTPEYMMDQQTQELANSRVNYQETAALGSGPLLIKRLTKEDLFTFMTVTSEKKKFITPSIIGLRTRVASLPSEEVKFKSLDEMVHFLDGSFPAYPKEEGIPYWDQDEWFASQRLQGTSPGLITMVKRLDPDFKIDGKRVSKITGKSLKKLIRQRRLYMPNLDMLKEYPKEIWAPMALFYIDDNEKLLPLAIQLQRDVNAADDYEGLCIYELLSCKMQNRMKEIAHSDLLWVDDGRSISRVSKLFEVKVISEGAYLKIILHDMEARMTNSEIFYTVFYSDDPKNSWILAKIFYNCAESVHHQMAVHLGVNHVLMDMAAISLLREVSPSHPVYKLMKPHFFGMFGNNMFGVQLLMSPGGVADTVLQGTSVLGLKLLSASLHNVDFRKINPLLDTKDRMVDDIPTYPFRDRSNDIYEAIWEYVDGIMSNYYRNNDQVKNDVELRAFRKMLAMNPKYQGMGWKNLPGSDKTGKMKFHQLVDILATMLYQATAGHAAINNNIYDSVSLVPNYPLKLKIPPIKPSDNVTEQTIIDSLPNKVEAAFVAEQGAGLSFDYGNELGYPQRPLLFSPKDQKVIERFRERLDDLKTKQYKETAYPYRWLDIHTIKNSMIV